MRAGATVSSGDSPSPRVAVFGVGNLLLSDEGVGPATVHFLLDRWDFPEEVYLRDAGTPGLAMVGHFREFEDIVVVDTVRGGGNPGDVYRFTPEQLPLGAELRVSAHDISIVDAWQYAQLLGYEARMVIVGVEPQDISTPRVGLTPALEVRLPVIAEVVLEELERLGVEVRPR